MIEGDTGARATVHPGARLGADVELGHGTVVYGNAEVGNGTVIGDHCVVGLPTGKEMPPVRIGSESLVRSHSVIYEGSDLGPRLETGHHTLIRAGARAGVNLRLGSYSSLEGELVIGDYGRIHGYAQIGAGAEVGDFVWIYSLCILMNDPLPPSDLFSPVTVGDGAVICPRSLVMPGSRVGRGAFVAAGATVSGEVPDGVVVGTDGRVGGRVDRLMNLESGIRHPWMRHFASAYPREAQDRLATLRDEILAACKSAAERPNATEGARG